LNHSIYLFLVHF